MKKREKKLLCFLTFYRTPMVSCPKLNLKFKIEPQEKRYSEKESIKKYNVTKH